MDTGKKIEVMQAYLEGATIVDECGKRYTLEKDGELVWDWYDKTYTIDKWYNCIPEGGILCWVSDTRPKPKKEVVEIITEVNPDSEYYKFKSGSGICDWKFAQPLTKKELEIFIKNAPK